MIDREDYLMLDRNSQNARYEYLDGELRMLAGGSPYHAAIIANLTIAIGNFYRRELEEWQVYRPFLTRNARNG